MPAGRAPPATTFGGGSGAYFAIAVEANGVGENFQPAPKKGEEFNHQRICSARSRQRQCVMTYAPPSDSRRLFCPY